MGEPPISIGVVAVQSVRMVAVLSLIGCVQLRESLPHRVNRAVPAGDPLALDCKHLAPKLELSIGVHVFGHLPARIVAHR